MPSIELEWIETVLARAEELRRAGVLSIGCDGHTAVLAPFVATIVKEDKPPSVDEPYVDPMNDPASYPGGIVPGFAIEKFDVED